MASYVFNNAKLENAKGNIDFSSTGDTFKIALVDTFPTGEEDAIVWSDISTYEVSGTIVEEGYEPGGVVLTNVDVFTTGNDVLVSATDVESWKTGIVISTIEAKGAVVYRQSDDLLICAVDLGTVSSSGGSLTVKLESGFLKIK